MATGCGGRNASSGGVKEPHLILCRRTQIWAATHRLENPAKIEVQPGSYLGEDDIVRIEDDYRRA